MPQFEDYPEDTAPSNSDLMVLLDIESGASKKVTRSNFLAATPLPANTVDTQAIENGAVTNDKLDTTAGELGGASAAWTPTLSGRFTDGDWLKACTYTKIGKKYFCDLVLVATDTTPMGGGSGDATFSLPVTSIAPANAGVRLGTVRLRDANGNVVNGSILHASTTTASIKYDAVSGSTVIEAGVTAGAPFTWTTNDGVLGTFVFEAA